MKTTKILISENKLEVRKILANMVQALGHEPILARVPTPETFFGCEACIVDTDGDAGARNVRAAHNAAVNSEISMPIIGVGTVRPQAEEYAPLKIDLAAWLALPLTLEQLREAIGRALER